jgi:hypothetical protein
MKTDRSLIISAEAIMRQLQPSQEELTSAPAAIAARALITSASFDALIKQRPIDLRNAALSCGSRFCFSCSFLVRHSC